MKSISISNIMERLVARNKDAAENENGFSLLELVVAIGILLVLTVGGLIGYSAITDNARDAAVDSAASDIFTAAMAAESDNLDTTSLAKVISDFESSSKADSKVVVDKEATKLEGNTLTVKVDYQGKDNTSTRTGTL